MNTFKNLSSFSCEIEIKRAKNLYLKSNGHLFVRWSLHAGENSRIQLNSKEIFSDSDLIWNESKSLDCSGSVDSIHKLLQGTIVFELQRRKTLPIFGRIKGSQLLGRAEVPWKRILESPSMEFQTWVVMMPKTQCVYYDEDIKLPSVQIAIKVRAVEPKAAPKTRVVKLNECGCRDGACRSCLDYDISALGVALEGF